MTKVHQSTPAIDPWQDFQALCHLGGRLCGTSSEVNARLYLTRRLKNLAIRYGGRFASLPVEYLGWSATQGKIISEKTSQKYRGQPLLYSPSTPPGGIEAHIVDLGRGAESDFKKKGREIAGKVALVHHEFMFSRSHIHRNQKYEWAVEHGACGFLIAGGPDLEGPVSGGLGLRGATAAIPAMGISHGTAALLSSSIENKVRLIVETRTKRCQTESLIYELPGEISEWIVVSAHLDGHCLGQSAIDNATGVATAISATESAISSLTPKRGIRLCLFSIEEWGLLSSKHYVTGLTTKEIEAIMLNINLDSVAGAKGLAAFFSDYSKLGQFLEEIASNCNVPLELHRPLVANSDHYNFAIAGIPSFRLLAGFERPKTNMRHVLTAEDTIDKVDQADLQFAVNFTSQVLGESVTRNQLCLR